MTETEAWPEGLKKTKQREIVLSVLQSSPVPLTAADVYDLTRRQGNPVSLSTVYRMFESFSAKGVIQNTGMQQNGMALYAYHRRAHQHYAVCLKCSRLIPMKDCPLQSMDPELAECGFQVTGHKLEMYGYCRDCSEFK